MVGSTPFLSVWRVDTEHGGCFPSRVLTTDCPLANSSTTPYKMSNEREDEATNGNQVMLVGGEPTSSAMVEVRKIHRRGGYFVGVAGWSGLAFWLIGKISGLITSGVIWGILLALGWSIADETTRIWVRDALGGGPRVVVMSEESQKFPLLKTDSYHELPIIWKQVLAEVQVNQSKYPARFVSIMQGLTLDDISTLEHIAPYVVGDAIVHAADFDIGYDIPLVTDLEFQRLQTIGIIISPQFGSMIKDIVPKNEKPAQMVLKGTTLALLTKASTLTETFKIHLTPLTEEGGRIIRLLKKPTSLKGLCMIAAQIKQRKKVHTAIFANLEPKSDKHNWSNRNTVVNVSQQCSQFGTPLVN